MKKKCSKHGITEHYKRSDCNSYRCKKCNVEKVTKRRRQLKIMAIEFLGGSCKVCGYNKCNWALTFHHKNPSKKDFRISDGNTKSWAKIKNELKKCVLVCQNCHHEIHAGVTDI